MADQLLEELIDGEEIEEQDREILLWITLGLAYGIDIFITRIEREIAILRSAGMGESSILGVLASDFSSNGRIFGEFRNIIKRGIVAGIMQSFRVGQDSVYGDNLELQWVSVGSPRICVDCESRVGETDTWKNWQSRGLPASGFSVCKEYCYCQLIPEGFEIDNRIVIYKDEKGIL
tara:strand:- start:1866 stop:2393 length:528 start_codon:yes stop_codon:yes gene_type:complete